MTIIYHVLDNPFDEDEPLSLPESDLAKGILKLAEELQHELYAKDGYDLSAQGKTIMDRVYRGLRGVVKTYFGNEHGLWYDPKPGLPFPRKESGK